MLPPCNRLRTRSTLLAAPAPSNKRRRRFRMRKRNEIKGNTKKSMTNVETFDVVTYGARDAFRSAYALGLGGRTAAARGCERGNARPALWEFEVEEELAVRALERARPFGRADGRARGVVVLDDDPDVEADVLCESDVSADTG